MTARRDSRCGAAGPAPSATVVGGGPAGLMAAEILASHGVEVVVFEHMASVGRKFLLAGRGGLNLTHSEALDEFLARYTWSGEPNGPSLDAAVREFSPTDLRAWAEGLGQPTFVGSSGRVFPTGLRANHLLARWHERLESSGVRFRTGVHWTGWRAGGSALEFETADGQALSRQADVSILAVGGASWPKVGSDGSWVDVLIDERISVNELTPSNCGFKVTWTEVFRSRFQGTPVKNVAVSTGGTEQRQPVRGELMIVAEGLEGGCVYALGGPIREQLRTAGEATIHIDLQPDIDQSDVEERLEHRGGKESTTKALGRLVGLERAKISLVRESLHQSSGGIDIEWDPRRLAALIKDLPLRLAGSQGLDRAISTAGGVAFSELDESFMIRSHPGVFCAGEMLDWDAPTGGYLLQATFSTAVAAAKGAIAWLST